MMVSSSPDVFTRSPPMLRLLSSPLMRQPKTSKRSPRVSVERRFYAGQYTSIIRDCVDGARPSAAAGDLPFVVGALAFVGRLEEARALFSSHLRRSAEPRERSTLVA